MAKAKGKGKHKDLIGKTVEWEYGTDPSRGRLVRSGLVQDVQDKNIQIDFDWLWYPDLHNLKVID